MSIPKVLALITVSLFLVIGTIGLWKKHHSGEACGITANPASSTEVFLATPKLNETRQVKPEGKADNKKRQNESKSKNDSKSKKEEVILPIVDRVDEFFNVGNPKFPIVETLTYKSLVPWLKGRSAWLVDYASHYQTSVYFIARSINSQKKYEIGSISNGQKFNVLSPEKNIRFYLIVDLSLCKMLLYYVDGTEKVLVKTYSVGLGRADASKESGFLTPLGKYSLGDNIGAYKAGDMGIFHHQRTEMIRIFGTRWIPFKEEIGNCTEPAKGFGIHGVPWHNNAKTGKLEEMDDSVGKYESDGCIRVRGEDVEEIFAIVTTKPTTIEIAKHFYQSEFFQEIK